MIKKGFIFSLCLILLSGQGVYAVPSESDLKRIEKQIEKEEQTQKEAKQKAIELSTEIRTVQRQMVQSAKTIQEKEELLSNLEIRLEKLKKEEKDLTEKLNLTDKQMVQVVTGLQTLALRPQELILFKTQTPIEAVRSHLLMQKSLPIIGTWNETVKRDLENLIQTQKDVQEQAVQIKSLTSQLNDRTRRMNRLIRQKARLQAQYDATHQKAKRRASLLAEQASDLKDLLAKLEADRQRRLEEERQRQREKRAHLSQQTSLQFQSGSSMNRSKGALLFPVRGRIEENFGDISLSGAHAKGMTIVPRANAQVIAPFSGIVLFSGPFKTYGQLLILDNGDGYLTLLAGMERINVSVGQEILGGEPIGTMGNRDPRLYVEIRKSGQPIDPRPWFSKR